MIGIDLAKSTTLVALTKVQIGGADLVLPAWARSIVAIEVSLTNILPVADTSNIAACYLESDDFLVSPFEVLADPIGGVNTANASIGTSPPGTVQRYAVNAAVNGGDRLRVYGASLQDTTQDPLMAVSVILSSEPPAFAQRFAKIGTLTGTGTATNTDVAGTAYTFTAGHRIVELYGALTHLVHDTGDFMNGYVRFESSEFAAPIPLKLMLKPVNAHFVDGMIGLGRVSRAPVDVPIRSPTTIQDYFNAVSLTTAGTFVTGIVYE